MRWTCAALLVLGTASAASGQVAWVGGSWGGVWEHNAPSDPNANLLHSSDGSPAVFVALPLNDDTLFRLKAADLPHVVVIDGVAWSGRYHAYTAGIDYMMSGSFGESLVSAGFGSYQLELNAKNPPPGSRDSKFGWYLAVGEWFTVTRKFRVTADVEMNQTQHNDKPMIFTANVGVAIGF